MASMNGVMRYEQENAEKLIQEYHLTMPKKSFFMSKKRYKIICSNFIKDASKVWQARCSITHYKSELPEKLTRYHRLCKIADVKPVYTLADIPVSVKLTGKEPDFLLKALQQCDELKRFWLDIYHEIQQVEDQARKKIFYKAVADAKPGQVVILRTDSTVAYEENRKKFFDESIKNMVLKKAAPVTGIIICGFFYDQIAFIPDRVKNLDNIFSLWCPDPLEVRVCYRY